MASADLDSFGNAPYLNSTEQNLLLNALNSNKGAATAASADGTLNPDLTQLAPDSSFFDPSLLENEFPTDFNWEFDADTLQGLRNDNGPTSSNSADGDGDGDGDDASPLSQDGKRKDHPDDDDDDDPSPGKRRESDGKIAKKPGRKPLTSEPTSKRKAQNRAAQRAFRERKEKHLRDLETKVDDLEKASEATNHENGILRAQVGKLQAEVSEYRKRMGSAANPAGYSPGSASNRMNWDLNSSFNFEFPAFGVEANDQSKTAAKAKECVHSLKALRALDHLERSSAEQDFYRSGSTTFNSPSPLSGARTMSMSTSNAGSTRPALGKTDRSPTNSTDKSGSISASPASLGLGSSCVTTPEASADSPQNKNDYGSFDARGSPNQPKTPGLDGVPSLDWFGNQNNAGFDPILFGDFEETQKNILNSADLGVNNFDTFPWNLDSTTSGMWTSPEPLQAAVQSAVPPKKSAGLMDRVDQAAQGNSYDDPSAVPKTPKTHNQLTCAKLWDRVQRSEKVLSGEADMDDLCSQLKAKAKCGGPNKGAVVDETDVDAILGPDPQKKKPAGMWNMFS